MAQNYHFPKLGCSVWFLNVLQSNMMNLMVGITSVPLLWAVRIFPPSAHLFYQSILKLGYVWYPCQGSENVYPTVRKIVIHHPTGKRMSTVSLEVLRE